MLDVPVTAFSNRQTCLLSCFLKQLDELFAFKTPFRVGNEEGNLFTASSVSSSVYLHLDRAAGNRIVSWILHFRRLPAIGVQGKEKEVDNNSWA